MSPKSLAILDDLQAVARLRLELASDRSLSERAFALKAYQARRFERTYKDLLDRDSEYRGAALFFLEELYAAKDFDRRDAQFARIVPSVVRIFSDEIISTVAALASLHALTERFDADMARVLPTASIGAADYIRAWQRCGRYEERDRQLALTVEIGRALQRHTRSTAVRRLLRLMRTPARAAGLGELQRFLELGFETFGRMRDPTGFLRTIAERERGIIRALGEVTLEPPPPHQKQLRSLLEQLP